MIRALPLILLLSACAQFPQLDASTPDDIGPRLALLPGDQLPMPRKQTQIRDDTGLAAGLAAQAAALRARK